MIDNAAIGGAVLTATPTEHNLKFRPGNFATLSAALDYAAGSQTGMNFYRGGRNELVAAATYSDIHKQTIAVAYRMQSLGLPRGSKVALIASTDLDFIVFFFACQYAGLVPTPLPAIIQVGGYDGFVRQIRGLIQDSQAKIVVASDAFTKHLDEACLNIDLAFKGAYQKFMLLPEDTRPLQPLGPDEVAYIQYTSGSTRLPRGVMVQSRAAMANLEGMIQHGVQLNATDRCLSWLPFYHDMGLVGLMLLPVACQSSVDYMGTREFAVRPRLWLDLLSKTKATMSYSPPFGYELCARRLRENQAERYDLSHWRIAGVGAEMIRSETLMQFADALKPANFKADAFLPSYGMAECSLGVSFSKVDQRFGLDRIDREQYADFAIAKPSESEQHGRTFIACGYPLPDHEIQIRADDGTNLPDRHVGTIFVRGPSLMCGYLNRPDLTAEVLSEDRWLNTGDLGYELDGQLFITGRCKDLIIINGRNIWPQDIEHIAESAPGMRSGDALAFALSEEGAPEKAVVVIQCKERDVAKRSQLANNIQSTIRADFGIDCEVELVPAHTLPRTSSGKLSRSQAKLDFIKSSAYAEAQPKQVFG